MYFPKQAKDKVGKLGKLAIRRIEEAKTGVLRLFCYSFSFRLEM